MSRREEEFKHRTSIFEGAYRAWSHVGGLEVDVLYDTPLKELDPVQHPLLDDVRSSGNGTGSTPKVMNDDGTVRLEYPYEPLPRSGLTHPYIKAILAPWLGPNADQEAVEIGLATLRTWWQHRRKGENKSSVKSLGTTKMRLVVDKYTKHFFDLAHCLITNDQVQAPRTLHLKLKQSKRVKHLYRGSDAAMIVSAGSNTSNTSNNNNNYAEDDMSASMNSTKTLVQPHSNSPSTLLPPSVSEDVFIQVSPLERMYMVQQNAIIAQQQEQQQGEYNSNVIQIKGKCIPGKIDLSGILDAVKRRTNSLSHIGSSMTRKNGNNEIDVVTNTDEIHYGGSKTTPLLFVTSKKEYMIVLKVDGITCAHCVKIVETVLKGCSGTVGKSPIVGLLDAAADHGVSSVIVWIDHPNHAKRIAFESKRNLSLVGYTAQPMKVQLDSLSTTSTSTTNLVGTTTASSEMKQQQEREVLLAAMIDVAISNPIDFFDFGAPCSCPDSGVYRTNCRRYVYSFLYDFFLTRRLEL
jgi:copper chaperone CopZ